MCQKCMCADDHTCTRLSILKASDDRNNLLLGAKNTLSYSAGKCTQHGQAIWCEPDANQKCEFKVKVDGGHEVSFNCAFAGGPFKIGCRKTLSRDGSDFRCN